jgi:hypothetical protein
MSFLRINGWSIPVDDFKRKPVAIGPRERAFDGTPHDGMRALKGSWQGSTTRQLSSIARAIEGAVLGLGEAFPFQTDLYSGSGVPATTGVTEFRPGYGADGARLLNGWQKPEAHFGTVSLAIEPATVNLLAANSRNAENAPTGYASLAHGVLSADVANKVQGSKSVKVVCGFADDGITTSPATAITAATKYTASVYVKASPGDRISLRMVQDVAPNFFAAQQVLHVDGSNEWIRLECTGTTAIGASTVYLMVTTDDGAATFYCDAFQLEAQSYATTWVDGTRAAVGNLAYPASILTPSYDATFAAWVRQRSAADGALCYLLRAFQSAGINEIALARAAATEKLYAFLASATGATYALTYDSLPWNDDWHHVALTFESRGDAGVPRLAIYVDGVAVKTGTPTATPNLRSLASLWVGCNATANYNRGLLTDVVLAPYAMCAGQIAGLYGLGKACSPLRRVYVDGDFESLPNATVLVLGSVESESHREGGAGGVFYTNLREVEFSLDEM